MIESPVAAAPEEESAETEGFQTYSRREILAILQSMIDRSALITLHFAQGEDYVVTNLLHLNPEFEELIFDGTTDAELSRRIIRSRRLTFVSFVDQIKVQFHAQIAEATTFDGRPALRIRVPDSVLRLQRRNFFRVHAPKSGPIRCEITLDDGATAHFSVGDLSVGGMGVIAGPMTRAFTPGAVFEHCKVELPGHGSFTTALQIRHAHGTRKDAQGVSRDHYGCQFANLAGPVVSLIQRYINYLERTRRTLV